MEKLNINKDSGKDRLSMDTKIPREYNSFCHSRIPSDEGYKNVNLSLKESKEKKEEINYSRDENLNSMYFNKISGNRQKSQEIKNPKNNFKDINLGNNDKNNDSTYFPNNTNETYNVFEVQSPLRSR